MSEVEHSPPRRSADHPELDPNVRVVGFDVCDLAPAEMRERGIRLNPRLVVVTSADPAWASHSEYASRDPRGDAMDRAYARAAARRHLARHASLEGLRLLRTFPCLGTYRHVEGAEGRLVQCDRCGDEFGLPPERPEDAKRARAAEEAEARWREEIPL